MRRLTELFDFTYVLEKFKPQRKYGYFAHPILLGSFRRTLDAEVDHESGMLRLILIAGYALVNDATVLSADHDFDHIAAVAALNHEYIAPSS